MKSGRGTSIAAAVLTASLMSAGPMPALASAIDAEVSDEALSLYFGSDAATRLLAGPADVPGRAPQRQFGIAEAQPGSPTAANAFDEARDLYAEGRWSAAYGRFAQLADEGHAEAAGIALLMLSNGMKLYGQAWSASQPQIDHWIALSRRRTEGLIASAGERGR